MQRTGIAEAVKAKKDKQRAERRAIKAIEKPQHAIPDTANNVFEYWLNHAVNMNFNMTGKPGVDMHRCMLAERIEAMHEIHRRKTAEQAEAAEYEERELFDAEQDHLRVLYTQSKDCYMRRDGTSKAAHKLFVDGSGCKHLIWLNGDVYHRKPISTNALKKLYDKMPF